VLFAAVSLAAFPFARATGMRAFVPFFGVDVFAGLALSRTVLLLPCFLALYGLIKLKRWKPLGPVVRGRAGAGGSDRARYAGASVLIGVAPVAVFMALYAPAAYGLMLPGAWPVSFGWFLLTAAVLAAQLWVEQEFLHYFFMPAFAPRETGAQRIGYIVTEAALRGVAFGIAFIPVLANPFQLIGRAGLMGRAPALPAFVVMGFFLFLPASALACYARRRGYNVVAPCLAIGLSTALFFSCFISSRAF